MKKYNVEGFGAVADGKTLCTKAVQNAVDYCHMQGGGVVLFERGSYVLSTVFLKSNVHIEIAENAEILGSLNFYDYAPQEKIDYPIYQDASHTYPSDAGSLSFRTCRRFTTYAEGMELFRVGGRSA